MEKKKKATPKRDKQATARLSEAQWKAVEALLTKDEWDLSTIIKKGIRLLCQEHGIEWPTNR